jgi:hypothetical protein
MTDTVWVVETWRASDDASDVEAVCATREGAQAVMEAVGMVVTDSGEALAGEPREEHRSVPGVKWGSAIQMTVQP